MVVHDCRPYICWQHPCYGLCLSIRKDHTSAMLANKMQTHTAVMAISGPMLLTRRNVACAAVGFQVQLKKIVLLIFSCTCKVFSIAGSLSNCRVMPVEERVTLPWNRIGGSIATANAVIAAAFKLFRYSSTTYAYTSRSRSVILSSTVQGENVYGGFGFSSGVLKLLSLRRRGGTGRA